MVSPDAILPPSLQPYSCPPCWLSFSPQRAEGTRCPLCPSRAVRGFQGSHGQKGNTQRHSLICALPDPWLSPGTKKEIRKGSSTSNSKTRPRHPHEPPGGARGRLSGTAARGNVHSAMSTSGDSTGATWAQTRQGSLANHKSQARLLWQQRRPADRDQRPDQDRRPARRSPGAGETQPSQDLAAGAGRQGRL